MVLGRYARILALLPLGAFVVDVGDGDCAMASVRCDSAPTCTGEGRANEVDSASGCACCIVAEAASSLAPLRASDTRAQRLISTAERAGGGVRPLPYRPPLLNS